MLVGMVSLLLAFFACTDGMSELQSGTLNQIVMTAPDFEAEDGSRTNVKITNAGAEFSWADNDTIGIFPTEGAQVSFPMASGAGTKTASFTGGGWALKDGVTYAAYYPFIGKFYLDKNAIPVDYTHQKQNGDASTVHISASDYMTAIPAAPENGSVNFVFRHLGALVQLKLAIPEPTTVYAVSLVAEDDAFITYGEMDVMAANASIAPVSTNNEITLSVENVTTTEANQTVTFYLMLPPADLSGKSLKAVVYTGKGNLDIALESKNFEAGKAYALGEIGDEIVDEESYDAVIKENTEMIDETFASYVTGTVNTSTIVMSASTPEELLPEIGEILLCGVEDEKFPYGFAGKVTQIKEEADGYVIETEQPELGEIFESINVEGEMPLEVIPQTESRGLELILDKESDEFKLTAEKYSDEAGFQGLSLDLTLDMEPSSNSSSDSSGNIDASFSGVNQITLGGDLGFKCAYKIVENVEGKEDCFDLNLDILSKLGLDVELGVEGKLGTDFELAKLEFAPFKVKFLNCFKKNKDNESRVAPAVVVKCIVAILDPKLILSYKTEASGKIGLNSGFECSNITNIYTKDKQLNIGTNKGTPVNWFSTINMEGKLQTGLNLKFTMKPKWRSGKEDNMLELEAFTGPQINATAETGYGSENNVCFDIVPWNNSLSGQVTIYSVMNNDIKFSASCEKEFSLGKQTRWLWPHYENLKANFNPANEKNIAVSALLKDTTIIPLKVGFALYDSDGNRLMNTDYLEYQIPAENGYSLQDEFVEMDDTKIYYVKPTVELLESTIDYEPTVKVKDSEDLKDALIKLYLSTNGDYWTNNDNWCTDLPVETWYGIKVNDEGYDIDLGNNNLTGKIEQSFPENVSRLNFSDNPLTVIDVSGSTALTVLGCSNNQKLTVLDVSGCTDLKELSLDGAYSAPLKVSGDFIETLYIVACQATCLDVSNCNSLQSLMAFDSELGTLDVSNCKSIKNVVFYRESIITSLNASGCTSLTGLGLDVKSLASLNLSGCTSLKTLGCDNRQMEHLNVSGCTSLMELDCSNNVLTSLNVSGCTSLTNLECSNNVLTSLDVSGCIALAELKCIDNLLSSLNMQGCSSLHYLECQNNSFTNLKISNLISLLSLRCYGASLKNLDISNCKSLKELILRDLNLDDGKGPKSLDISKCNSLELMFVSSKLESLHVFECSKLNCIDGADTGSLEKIYLKNCFNLGVIPLSKTLKELDVSGCPLLSEVHVYGVSSNSKLTINLGPETNSLVCYDNKLKELIISGNALTNFYCSGNQLTSLDFSKCLELSTITYSKNSQLTSLSLDECTSLTTLTCEENEQLTSIDLSMCKKLSTINCHKNKHLPSLDLNQCVSLTELRCYENSELKSIDVSGCDALEIVHCYNNQLTELNVSGCNALWSIDCPNNQLTDIDISTCTKLRLLNVENNKITKLITSPFTRLSTFYYDKRYRYYKKDGETKYEDLGVGWWYPGEPGKGKHEP